MNKYFSYDPADAPEMRFYATSEAARTAAEKSLDLERETAAEGWSQEVVDNPICWGFVFQCMTEVSRRKLSKSEADASGFDEVVDYQLKDID